MIHVVCSYCRRENEFPDEAFDVVVQCRWCDDNFLLSREYLLQNTPPGMKKMEDYRYSGLQKKLFVITVVLLFLILAL